MNSSDSAAVSASDTIPKRAHADFLQSELLAPCRDPESGIVSYVLTPVGTSAGEARLATLQQSFYYVNPSLWLGTESKPAAKYWFMCAWPPSDMRLIALADFTTGRVKVFSDASNCSPASNVPMLHPETGEVYWANTNGIWKLAADFSSSPEYVNAFTQDVLNNRRLQYYASHLTLDADGASLGIDARIGSQIYMGHAPLDGSPVEIWNTSRRLYNHGQCNPRRPGIMLQAQENQIDQDTGQVTYKDNRMWISRRSSSDAREATFFPVYPRSLRFLVDDSYRPVATNPHLATAHRVVRDEPRQMHGHEWWSGDGEYIYYIHYQTGIERTPLATAGTEDALPELVWPHKTVSHAHTSPCGNYLVLDSLPPDDPDAQHVRFVNLVTRREVDIVSHMAMPAARFRAYHPHSHPQFCGPHGEYICYSRIQPNETIDVAFVRVDDLIEATS
ncbi:hypothetical protein [Ruficoccus sp. ZRK36]|uniref:hypothetical protein n=1 Tax=Ruficoccus sp. ZRK36 TaxID=2866311 RepID=UPI001C735EB8|nr:hypothetical protein [Ruficoccus sp. ZRK36]QYY35055.1 hypothetical protein K0V07_12180 [Ruficoccus sp. ZRK36]